MPGPLHIPDRDSSVVAWLLDSEPALRWQVLRDVVGTPPSEFLAERDRVATEGSGARLLALQEPGGTWGGLAWNHNVDSTSHVLVLLRELGLPPESAPAARALALVREQVYWRGSGPEECDDNRFFEGEVEPCINGQVALAGAYFGADVRVIIDRLLGEQLEDGGWNCEAEFGSRRSSFHTTICVLEALLEHEQRFGAEPAITAARIRGEEYLLARHLMRRLSTGEVIDRDRKEKEPPPGAPAPWAQLAFPGWWRYDILRALDYFRSAHPTPDPRAGFAVEVLLARRDAEGRWPLDRPARAPMPVDLGDTPGAPSRWNTMRALRVLRWWRG